MLTLRTSVFTTIAACSLCFGQPDLPSGPLRELSISDIDGGAATVHDLLGRPVVNVKSTLHRRAIVLNDSTAPIQLVTCFVAPEHEIDRFAGERFNLRARGALTSKEPVSAVEVRILIFDVFGAPIKTLTATIVEDLPSGAKDIGWTWRSDEHEAQGLLTSVAFIARVRTGAGNQWGHNSAAILGEIRKLQIQVKAEDLSPLKAKDQ